MRPLRRAAAAGAAAAAAAVVVVGAPAESGGRQQALIDSGRELYADGCASCHGPRGEGVVGAGPATGAGRVQGAGPRLIGVGAASLELYLSTGYMPLDNAADRPKRKEPEYTAREIDAIVAYVLSLGPDGPPPPSAHPERGDLSEGLEAFTEYCAGCHQVVAEGGVLLDGVAPELERSTPSQIAAAVRVGPYLMPRFGEKEIDQRTLDSLARYIAYTDSPRDDGGWGIGHIGPIPEGLAAWVAAALALAGLARVIGKRLA